MNIESDSIKYESSNRKIGHIKIIQISTPSLLMKIYKKTDFKDLLP